ncbi:putative bifunctional diguanylate cyclase/phosphodiesterase [Paucibacter sp. KCTC 42545]|uniref:putative bifunctional diguanylate cyclase/phosphodiesterase n=1 Tax=Paucibacter sp. KCTC 42545 TaxID=1768242 RepID=UPI0009EAE192|nr:EAL domain-containing protein [Paucibacter sp. KCTC 42545]
MDKSPADAVSLDAASRTPDKALEGVANSCVELAERKRKEEALRRSKAMLERTEKLARIGSFEWEVDSNITTWSPEMFRIYGRDPALGTPNLEEQVELYTPQSVQLLYAAVDKLLLDGTPYEMELMSVQPNGEQRPCLVRGFPERDESGRVVRLAGLVQDITERKLAEHYERFRSKTLELLAANKPLATLLETIVRGVEQLHPGMLCSILLLDADGLHLGKGVAPSLPDFYNAALDGVSIGLGVGSCGTAAFTGKRVVVDDIATHPYWALYKGLASSAGLGACWSQPIHSSVGKVLGTFAIYHRGPNTPEQADINLIEQVANLASIAIERKEQQNQLEHIAHFDALTNLPNRSLLADRLQLAMAQEHRRGQQLAVVYLDLDGFKTVNDRHGHNVGDRLLIDLATRMKDALRDGDTLARIGGDEFVAVLVDLAEPAIGEPLLNRLLTAAASPVQVGDLLLQVSASLGVTFYPQAQDIDADQLLRQADQAMYQAKVAGKSRYHVFDAAKDSNLRGHHESLERIRLALAQGEFVLHYQPKVNMRSGQVVGAEALIRWQHPEKGLLAPATFLPLIEDHPLAVAVGEWVIDAALHQMSVWQASGLHLPVSVNIGARQLQQMNFVDRLKAILAKHPQVRASDLELEVLETSALEDIALVSSVIEDCAAFGVKCALDDFGTGYSSLTYLKRLRVALLKIDQSFVRDMLDDPDDLAILQGVIGLAVAFRRQVIAEGVETVAHGAALLQLGCELAQGYGIARPMPAEQMPAWVATWRPDAAWCGAPNSPQA